MVEVGDIVFLKNRSEQNPELHYYDLIEGYYVVVEVNERNNWFKTSTICRSLANNALQIKFPNAKKQVIVV
jgi:hypothetical protein